MPVFARRSSPLLPIVAVLIAVVVPTIVFAQTQENTPPPKPDPSDIVVQDPDPDLQLVPGEPDFTLVALPSTLRMPKGKFAFRLTHRFNRPIAEGDFGDFAANFFGLDSAAKVGFELRYGLRPGTQAAVHRTSDRTIQFMGQHELFAQSDTRAFTLDAIAAIEGGNNFSEHFGGTIGAVISRRFGERGAAYVQPYGVFNSNNELVPFPDDSHTFMVGLGGRWRIGMTRAYLVGEVTPRLAGFRPGVEQASFGIETRAGGHLFQFNVSNSLGTTFGQIARSGPRNDWYIGFNLTRKFF
jgi:hypothetical protein